MTIPLTTDLVERETISTLVATYQLASLEVAQAYTLLEQAQQRLRGAFLLDKYSYAGFDTNPRDCWGVGEQVLEQVQLGLRKDAWHLILERMGVRPLLSLKRREELDEQVRSGKNLPELTEEAVLSLFQTTAAKLQSYSEEKVKEVFEFLRPPRSRHKTNTEFELGRRVILGHMVEVTYQGRFRPNYHRDRQLIALDSVFHLLDGKGPVKTHYGPLHDAITTSDDGRGETDYFRFRCCQNGNLHLEFRRTDLVTRLNMIAGGNRIKT